MIVAQGKQDFMKRWGKRKNADNWRRSNLTVVSMEGHEGFDYEADDSIRAAEKAQADTESTDTLSAATDSLQSDPHQREYYLAQIPFSAEAKEASDNIIKDGLYNAGIIEKDDLEDFPLAAATLERLTTQYTDYENMADAYYQLFLLYSRWGRTERAQQMRQHMTQLYPNDERTKVITDPNFEFKARFGKAIEDSLYAATYQAYRQRNLEMVGNNFDISTKEYPAGANRPKFIFVHALSRLGTAPAKEVSEELRQLVKDFPESDVSPLAGMIVKGLEAGRKPGTGTFDLGSLWDRRTAEATTAEQQTQAKRFSPDRNAPFLFVLAYPTDSVDNNKLLYEMAQFNFSSFVVRGFDMSIVQNDGLSQFRIAGFLLTMKLMLMLNECLKTSNCDHSSTIHAYCSSRKRTSTYSALYLASTTIRPSSIVPLFRFACLPMFLLRQHPSSNITKMSIPPKNLSASTAVRAPTITDPMMMENGTNPIILYMEARKAPLL